MKKTEKSRLLQSYNKSIAVTCAIGMILSAYAYYVEISAESDHDYNAMCDISEHISCTKVFTSEYGKGFGIIGKVLGEDSMLNLPNGFLGTMFYGAVAILCFSNDLRIAKMQLAFNIVSVLASIRLAYILYYILYDFCVVCVSTYVVNIVNTIFSFLKVREIKKKPLLKKNR